MKHCSYNGQLTFNCFHSKFLFDVDLIDCMIDRLMVVLKLALGVRLVSFDGFLDCEIAWIPAVGVLLEF